MRTGRPAGLPVLAHMSRLWSRRVLVNIARRLWIFALASVFVGLAAAWLAGWRLENVQSASMAPVIPKGSLAVVIPVSPREIESGDIISFFDPAHRETRILHRVADVLDRGAEGLFFRTQGDANATPDPLVVPAGLVEGGLRWHVPRLGSVAWMLRPPAGLAVLVAMSALVSLRGADPRPRAAEGQKEPSSDAGPIKTSTDGSLARLSSEELRAACAVSWRRYFVRDPRLDAKARLKTNLATSWRSYYVSLTEPPTRIDIRDRLIELDRVVDPAAEAAHPSTERR